MPSMLFDKEGGGSLTQRILQHVRRYRITTPHVVERLFFQSSKKGTKSLEQARALLDGLVSEAKLTQIAKPKKKAKQAAKKKPKWTFVENVYVYPDHKIKAGDDLARLWFCCLDTERRLFAQHEEIKPLFEAEGINPPYHNFFHALAEEEGGTVLYRLYLCRAEKKNARDQIKGILTKYAKQFHHWIEQGSYGVAIIVQTKQKKNEIEQLLQKSYGGRPPLNDQARFIVSVVPTEADYEQAIQQYEKEASR